jgi:hypothetical protein
LLEISSETTRQNRKEKFKKIQKEISELSWKNYKKNQFANLIPEESHQKKEDDEENKLPEISVT